jgi:signal peptidase II
LAVIGPLAVLGGKNLPATARGLGLLVAALTLAVDQANKLWLIFTYGIEQRQPVHLTPFFDIVFAKNPGISYSLLSANSAAGRWALLAMTLVATACLAFWLYRSRTRITAFALGLIIGGALGNAYDRFAYGFVADFYHLHLGGFSWYVFNLADVAIVVGVGLLLFESVVMNGRAARKEHAPT